MVALGAKKQLLPNTGETPFTGRIKVMVLVSKIKVKIGTRYDLRSTVEF
jgi:hypothetical protein